MPKQLNKNDLKRTVNKYYFDIASRSPLAVKTDRCVKKK